LGAAGDDVTTFIAIALDEGSALDVVSRPTERAHGRNTSGQIVTVPVADAWCHVHVSDEALVGTHSITRVGQASVGRMPDSAKSSTRRTSEVGAMIGARSPIGSEPRACSTAASMTS